MYATDAKIFKTNDTRCFVGDKVSVKNCDYICRILAGLTYYQSLNIENHALKHDIFTQFCKHTYGAQLFDDWIHILTVHSNHIEDIHNQLNIICSVKDCTSTRRHYNRSSDNDIDAEFIIYRQTMDTIHMYLLHLAELGLRRQICINSIKEENKSQNDENDVYKCFDTEFSKQKQSVLNRRQNSINIDRYNQVNNKYNINMPPTHSNDDDNGVTYIDKIMMSIISTYNENIVETLTHFLQDEEYDTDGIKEDFSDDINESNLMLKMNNYEMVMKIKKKFFQLHTKPVFFSTGFTFYYWSYYKQIADGMKIAKEENTQELQWNINDHNGYQIKDLYVAQKYKDLKSEILTYITIDKYNTKVLLKSQIYMNTEKVRKMEADTWKIEHLHYGITAGDKISINHLMVLIMYCDFTKFCTKFSESFRCVRSNEPLSCVKKRNSEFWWNSKILRETVQIYGVNRWDHSQKGPFYCGISVVMNIPQFSIRLSAPTSTSKQIQVAINFATKTGMILQVNNYGARDMDFLRLFDCCWISNYGEEDECLFMGGDRRVRIQSVRIISSGLNFGIFMHSLYVFDCMVNGSLMEGIKIQAKDLKIIAKLVSGKDNVFHTYIHDTFELFCITKAQITINMYFLDSYFKKSNHLLFSSLKEDRQSNETNNNSKNVLNTLIFDLFKNVTKIIIYTTSNEWGRFKTYSFSLISFLDVISSDSSLSSSWKEIKIIAVIKHNNSWINKLWSPSSAQIIGRYNAKKLNIYKQKDLSQNYVGHSQDILVIKR
eukprot:47571_1